MSTNSELNLHDILAEMARDTDLTILQAKWKLEGADEFFKRIRDKAERLQSAVQKDPVQSQGVTSEDDGC